MLQPQKVEVLLGGGLGSLAASTTDAWPANDARYTASITHPPAGKYSYRCRATTADGATVYYPALRRYRYFTVDPDLAQLTLVSPAHGTVVSSSATTITVDVQTNPSTYGYSVRVYYSADGSTFRYKTATRVARSASADTWRVTLTRGTHFSAGLLHLYAYGRDGNAPTLYDKNGGTGHALTVR